MTVRIKSGDYSRKRRVSEGMVMEPAKGVRRRPKTKQRSKERTVGRSSERDDDVKDEGIRTKMEGEGDRG